MRSRAQWSGISLCLVACPADFQLCAPASLRLLCQAEHSSVVKAQYDYDAAAEGELSVKEDQLLLAFGTEEDGWLLVQDKVGGNVGYVPGNYIEVSPFFLYSD